MRVRILVEAEHLGDVEVSHEDHLGTLDGSGAQVRLAQLISDAVTQTLDAYRLNERPPTPYVPQPGDLYQVHLTHDPDTP